MNRSSISWGGCPDWIKSARTIESSIAMVAPLASWGAQVCAASPITRTRPLNQGGGKSSDARGIGDTGARLADVTAKVREQLSHDRRPPRGLEVGVPAEVLDEVDVHLLHRRRIEPSLVPGSVVCVARRHLGWTRDHRPPDRLARVPRRAFRAKECLTNRRTRTVGPDNEVIRAVRSIAELDIQVARRLPDRSHCQAETHRYACPGHGLEEDRVKSRSHEADA
jgi:hypothetical protein